jgi:hypothetical protein
MRMELALQLPAKIGVGDQGVADIFEHIVMQAAIALDPA